MGPHEILEDSIDDLISPTNPYRAVACSSGTAGLHLALEALQLPKGSQVIVPEFTMIACARAVTLAGLRPVFVDCGEDDWNIDPVKIVDAITPLTSAILVAHIYGRRCDMEAIRDITASCTYDHDLRVIEDCSEFHGGELYDNYSDAYVWSFYKNKIVCGEEGGLVYFRSEGTARLARSLRCQGFTEDHDFLHTPFGHNYRLPDSQASLIIESLQDLQANLQLRRAAANRYDYAIRFKDPAGERICSVRKLNDIPWVYPIQLSSGDKSVDEVVKQMNEEGYGARLSFKPMSEQTEYRGHHKHLNAYNLSRSLFYLPLAYPSLIDAEGAIGLLREIVYD